MKVLYLPIDERHCNYRFSSMYFSDSSKIELNTIPTKYMGHMKEPGDIDGIFSYLEESLLKCDIAVLSFELLMYGGYLPSRVHTIPIIQLKDRLKKIESLLRRKGKNSLIYLFSNIMMTTPYSSSENDCNYYSNYGEFIFKRSYLLDKKKNIGLSAVEEQKLNDCIKMLPFSVIKDYETRVSINNQLILDYDQLLKDKVIDNFAINMESKNEYGYDSIAKKAINNHFKTQNIDDKVLWYSADELGFILICRAIMLYGKNAIKVSILLDSDGDKKIIALKKNKIQGIIELSGAVYSKDIGDCDLILFVHCKSYSNAKLNDEVYDELIKLKIPFVVVDDAFNNKVDFLFVKSIFEIGVSDDLLSYSCSTTMGKPLASGLIQYKYGTKQLRDKALFETMAYEYAFKSCVRDKYANILKYRSVGILIHINDKDVELKEKIKEDLELQLHALYKILPYKIKEISFPWYRIDEITINFER